MAKRKPNGDHLYQRENSPIWYGWYPDINGKRIRFSTKCTAAVVERLPRSGGRLRARRDRARDATHPAATRSPAGSCRPASTRSGSPS